MSSSIFKKSTGKSFFTVKLATQSTKNLEKWRAWRKTLTRELQACSASTIAAFYGHHYESYSKTLKDMLIDKEEDAECWQMGNVAKKHGEDKEPLAKQALMDCIKTPANIILNGETTTVYNIIYSPEQSALLMATPDMIVDCDGGRVVVEFKCPYFELYSPSLKKSRSVTKVATDYMFKHRHGRENSFLQAFTYATLENIKHFYVCYYFTDDITEAMVMYCYEIKNEGDENVIAMAALEIQKQLSKEPGDINCRTLSSDKKMISNLVKTSFVYSMVAELQDDGMWHSLDEYPSDYSKEKGPEIPWKPCCLGAT